MRYINNKGILFSNLGFGTSLLTRNCSLSAAISNLEVAYENGVTHFDCAKLYGFGQAEVILGKFAKNKRDKITIASKSGLYPRKLPLVALPLINALRNADISFLKKKYIHGSATNLGVFHPKILKIDIEHSLKTMQMDYIDFYLLHEANVLSANQFDIIATLQTAQKEGKIREFGLASNYLNLIKNFDDLDTIFWIIQHNYPISLGNKFMIDLKTDDRLRIIYNIFSDLNQLKISNEYSKLGFNSAVDYILAHYSRLNTSGITLFASVNNARIKETAKLWAKHN